MQVCLRNPLAVTQRTDWRRIAKLFLGCRGFMSRGGPLSIAETLPWGRGGITTTFDAPRKRHSRVCCCNLARVGRSTSMFTHRNKPPPSKNPYTFPSSLGRQPSCVPLTMPENTAQLKDRESISWEYCRGTGLGQRCLGLLCLNRRTGGHWRSRGSV